MTAWLLLSAALAAEPPVARVQAPLEIGAAWTESRYFQWASELSDAVEGRRLLVQTTSGSADNLDQLADGQLDLAIAQSDVAWHSWAGSGRVEHDEDLVAIGRAHTEIMHVLVARTSGINSLDDLKGRRTDLGRMGSGSVFAALDMLQAVPVEVDADYGGGLIVERLAAKRIDAAAYVTEHPDKRVEKAGRAGRILDLGDVADRLAAAPYYRVVPLPEALGQGRTIAVEALVVCHRSLPDADVKRLLATGMLDASGVSIPFHPAARKFFEARGDAMPTPPGEFAPPPLPDLPSNSVRRGRDKNVRFASLDEVMTDALTENNLLEASRRVSEQARIGASGVLNVTTLPVLTVDGGVEDDAVKQETAVGVSTWTGTTVAASVGAEAFTEDDPTTFQTTAGLGLRQQLLDGLMLDQNRAVLKRARIDAETAKLQQDELLLGVRATVHGQYAELTEGHERIKVRKRRVNLAIQHRNRVALKAEIDGNYLALEDAEASLAKAREDLIKERRDMLDAEDALLDTMDADFRFRVVPIGTIEEAADALIADRGDESLADRVEQARKTRPDLARRELAVQRAGIDLIELRYERLPTLAMDAGLGVRNEEPVGSLGQAASTTLNDGKLFWGVGATATVPLGRSAENYQYRQAELAVEQRTIELTNQRETATREVRTAWRATNTAAERLATAREGREHADAKLALALALFRQGRLDSFKVLRYQDDYLDAQLRVLTAAREYVQASANLDRATAAVAR